MNDTTMILLMIFVPIGVGMLGFLLGYSAGRLEEKDKQEEAKKPGASLLEAF